MRTLSATCVAIASAAKSGTLRLTAREGRFGAYVAIEDAVGVIEVADDMAAAVRRVQDINERLRR